MLPNSRALKIHARNAMSDNRPNFWVITLVYLAMVTVLPNLIYEIFDASLITLIATTMESATNLSAGALLDAALIGLFVTLVVQLVSMVVQLGYSLWSLRCWRREEENGFGSLFEGFGMVGRLLLCNIIVLLNILGWSFLLITALSTVLSPLMLTNASALTYILLPIYCITAFIAISFIFLRYTLVPFVLLDRPELGVFKVIGLAVSMMRGRIWAIFRLHLSFIWWYLFSGVLSWGVSLLVLFLSGQLLNNMSDVWGVIILTGEPLPYWLGLVASLFLALFLTPYINVTVAGFYDSLIQPPQPKNSDSYNDIY